MQDGLKVLFISGLDGDTRRYRCFHHQEQLALQGVATEFRESDDPQLLVDALGYDVFVLHRVPYGPLVSAVIDLVHLCGKPVVFETDDLIFDPTLYERIGFVDTLSPEAARRYRDGLSRLAETFERCDCVLTTTEFLAGEARQRGKPAYVHRNAPSREMVRISEQAFAAQRQQLEREQEDRPVVIAFFSGTGSHNRNFRLVAEPLTWVLERYPQVWLHISGHLELGPEFSPYLTRIRKAPYVAWRELPYLIARVDINLAPLEQENPFCQAKSENKFIEAALVGVPTIASRVESFQLVITHGKDGLLATLPEEWKEALQTLLDDPQKRREMGKAARHMVYTRYMPEQRAPELVKTFQAIADQFEGTPVAHEQILSGMAERWKQYAGQMRAESCAREAQVASLRHVLEQYEDQFAFLSRLVKQREQTIEAIMQGRVMRLMTGIQRWLKRIRAPN